MSAIVNLFNSLKLVIMFNKMFRNEEKGGQIECNSMQNSRMSTASYSGIGEHRESKHRNVLRPSPSVYLQGLTYLGLVCTENRSNASSPLFTRLLGFASSIFH